MGYSFVEQRNFFEKDAKNSIGQSRGNALSKAVDLIMARGGIEKYDDNGLMNEITRWADKFHHFNQVSIEKDLKAFLEINSIEKWYRDLEENDTEIKRCQEPQSINEQPF